MRSLAAIASSGQNYQDMVQVYIQGPNEENKTNMFCLISFIFNGLELANNQLTTNAALTSLLQKSDQMNDWGNYNNFTAKNALPLIISSQITYTLNHAGYSGVEIDMGDGKGKQPALVAVNDLIANDYTSFMTLQAQTLLLKLIMNNLIITRKSQFLSMQSGFKTGSSVKIVTAMAACTGGGIADGTNATNRDFNFVPYDNIPVQSAIREFEDTSATKATAGIMDALTTKKAYQAEPASGMINMSDEQLDKTASARGKEAGDRSLQQTAFRDGATCISGDLPSFMVSGCIKSIEAQCDDRYPSSRRMVKNRMERGDNCSQIFVRASGIHASRLSVMAIQVLQVAQVDNVANMVQQLVAEVPPIIEKLQQRQKALLKCVTANGQINLNKQREEEL